MCLISVIAVFRRKSHFTFYLADDCILDSSDKYRRRLRSADVDTCIVPKTRTRFGDRSFPAAGLQIWNSLPPELRRPDTELGEFRRLLKTFLFASGQPRWQRTSDSVIVAPCTSFSYYYYYYYYYYIGAHKTEDCKMLKGLLKLQSNVQSMKDLISHTKSKNLSLQNEQISA